MLGREYKFYLSFENSLCRDYVTEKFYLPLLYSMVPIAYGGADYEASPSSFIDVRNFPTGNLTFYHTKLKMIFNYSKLIIQQSIWRNIFIFWTEMRPLIVTILIGALRRLVMYFLKDRIHGVLFVKSWYHQQALLRTLQQNFIQYLFTFIKSSMLILVIFYYI